MLRVAVIYIFLGSVYDVRYGDGGRTRWPDSQHGRRIHSQSQSVLSGLRDGFLRPCWDHSSVRVLLPAARHPVLRLYTIRLSHPDDLLAE